MAPQSSCHTGAIHIDHNLNLIDTHVHLNEMEDVDQALQRAFSAGVTRMVAVGMDLTSNRQTLRLAKQFPKTVYPAIG